MAAEGHRVTPVHFLLTLSRWIQARKNSPKAEWCVFTHQLQLQQAHKSRKSTLHQRQEGKDEQWERGWICTGLNPRSNQTLWPSKCLAGWVSKWLQAQKSKEHRVHKQATLELGNLLTYNQAVAAVSEMCSLLKGNAGT